MSHVVDVPNRKIEEKIYNKIEVAKCYTMLCLLFLLGSETFSTPVVCLVLLLPRQLPLMFKHVVLMTRKA